MNRLGIFFFYDRDGIVDRYIPVMLEDICKNLERLVVVVNGKLTEEGKKRLLPFSNEIIVRENKGLDVWAYKTALEHVGYDHLPDYDEVVMFNHTMMGPVYPFSEMFDAMAEKHLDFWGISEFFKTDFDPFGTLEDGYIPDHIQSYFIAIRKSLAGSKDFIDYWKNMPMIDGYLDSVSKYETQFTKTFSEKGYRWAVYLDAEEYKGYTYQPIVSMPKEMIEKYHSPIFKRRTFMQDYNVVLNESTGEAAVELWNYLRDHTSYDMDLIWENILRLENMAILKRNLHWNYFLPSDVEKTKDAGKKDRTALFMHIYFRDTIDQCMHYAASMPENADLYITTNSEEQKSLIEEKFSSIPCHKLEVKVVPNSGRDVGPFLVEVQNHLDDYDYICHVHDKKAGQVKPGTVGLSFAYKCFENVLGSKAYVSNILDIFHKNPRAGLLMPPPPNHADYYITLGLEWGLNYQNTVDLMKELKIHAPIRSDCEPIAPLGSYFWARTDAIRPVFQNKTWTYEDFPKEPIADDGTYLHAIERIYPFAAQSAGYYAGWIMTDYGSAMEVENLNFMLHELNKIIFFQGGDAGNWNDTRAHMSESYEVVHRHPHDKNIIHFKRAVKNGRGWEAIKKYWRRKHDR